MLKDFQKSIKYRKGQSGGGFTSWRKNRKQKYAYNRLSSNEKVSKRKTTTKQLDNYYVELKKYFGYFINKINEIKNESEIIIWNRKYKTLIDSLIINKDDSEFSKLDNIIKSVEKNTSKLCQIIYL